MSKKYLGDSFDIHGGGKDLIFPHHENEIAQSEAATGKPYVNYWMHAGAVRVNKEKMSKSLGNFFTIREVLEKYPAEVIRYFLVSSHYRSQVDYSEASLKEAHSALERFYQSLRGIDVPALVNEKASEEFQGFQEKFEQAMADDFNTPEALAVMFDLVRALNTARQQNSSDVPALASLLKKLGGVLGILQLDPEVFFKGEAKAGDLSDAQVETLIAERTQARADKNWSESDRIRDLLAEQGIVLDDSKSGTTWRRG